MTGSTVPMSRCLSHGTSLRHVPRDRAERTGSKPNGTSGTIGTGWDRDGGFHPIPASTTDRSWSATLDAAGFEVGGTRGGFPLLPAVPPDRMVRRPAINLYKNCFRQPISGSDSSQSSAGPSVRSARGMAVSSVDRPSAWTARVQNLSFLQIDVLIVQSATARRPWGLPLAPVRCRNRTVSSVCNETKNPGRPIALKAYRAPHPIGTSTLLISPGIQVEAHQGMGVSFAGSVLRIEPQGSSFR
jgi:hypothetical protein